MQLCEQKKKISSSADGRDNGSSSGSINSSSSSSSSSSSISFSTLILLVGLLTCKNHLPYNLYCVGGDVKHYTIQSRLSSSNSSTADIHNSSYVSLLYG